MKILVVDDEALLVKGIRFNLMNEGYEVITGSNGLEALQLVQQEHPDLEIKTARAEGLRECRKLMTLAKAGKYNGYLLEGMGCPGGCVAGAGTLLPVDLAAKVVGKYQSEATTGSPLESPYRDRGEDLD